MSAEKQKFAELLENATLLLAEKTTIPATSLPSNYLKQDICGVFERFIQSEPK